MAHPNNRPTRKVTYTVREDLFAALRVIREEELHMQSHVVDKALRQYLKDNYQELLARRGVNLWGNQEERHEDTQ